MYYCDVLLYMYYCDVLLYMYYCDFLFIGEYTLCANALYLTCIVNTFLSECGGEDLIGRHFWCSHHYSG